MLDRIVPVLKITDPLSTMIVCELLAIDCHQCNCQKLYTLSVLLSGQQSEAMMQTA